MRIRAIASLALLPVLGASLPATAATFTFDDTLGNNSPYGIGTLADPINPISISGSSYTGTGYGAATWAFDFSIADERIVTGALGGGTNIVDFTDPRTTLVLYDPANPFGGPSPLSVSSSSITYDLTPGNYRFVYSMRVQNHTNIGDIAAGGIPDPVPYTFASSLNIQSVPDPGTFSVAAICCLVAGLGLRRRDEKRHPATQR